MSYREFTEKEIKSIQRFSIEIFRRYKIQLTSWKIESNGNLTIKLNYDTNDYHFDDTVYILRKNRMNLKNTIIEFKISCEKELESLSDPFDWDGDDDFGNTDYDIYRE